MPTHQKPKRALKAVSFFCGCGGMDLGFQGGFSFNRQAYKKLPFDVIAAYDIDEKCIKTYKTNISQAAQKLDLHDFNPLDIPKADVLCGGFPCQDFAQCGHRKGLKTKRGRLYRAMLQYMEIHRPKVMVGENVPGLVNHNKGRTLLKICDDINHAGYRVDKWMMQAPDYGVPQKRNRLFIIAVRDDIKGMPVCHPAILPEERHRSVKWAIADLKGKLNSYPNQGQFFKAARAKKGHGQGDEKLCADKPSYTMRANPKSRVPFHYSLKRRLTIRECARIQTFPDNFVFPFSATDNITQIGNAVPPVLAYYVAKSIAKFMLANRA